MSVSVGGWAMGNPSTDRRGGLNLPGESFTTFHREAALPPPK